MTPEGKIKATVKKILRSFGAYWFCPVQQGYGAHGLDFHCHVNRRNAPGAEAFYIETKKPGGKLTDRQTVLAGTLTQSGAKVFVIDGNYEELVLWLTSRADRIE